MFPDPTVRGRDDLVITVPGNSATAGSGWDVVEVPEWARWCHIFLLGAGGTGGNGVVGANSTAAGGGGGGSAGQTSLSIPAFLLPRTLYVSVGLSIVTAAGIATRIAAFPDTTANNCIALANGGGAGGNAAGATAGAAGTGGTIASLGTMPLGGAGVPSFIVGQAGIIGGVAVSGSNLNIPVTGLLVTGGTGGGGLPAAAVAGTNGGSFTIPAGAFFPPHSGGIGAALAATPGGNGSHGFSDRDDLFYHFGGTGGGSSMGTAVGAGLVGGLGGEGGIGSGGGGGGGALTGSTQGTGGKGGDGVAIISFI